MPGEAILHRMTQSETGHEPRLRRRNQVLTASGVYQIGEPLGVVTQVLRGSDISARTRNPFQLGIRLTDRSEMLIVRPCVAELVVPQTAVATVRR